jgi:hypothetical protein
MKEIPFSIPVSGVIRIDNNVITVIINRAVTTVTLEAIAESPERTHFEPGKSMFDIVLASAQEFIRRKKYNRFTGLDLFAIARENYPGLNKRSFITRITASTPDHPSFKHHLAHRDYFSRIATGIFTLEHRYLPKQTADEDDEPSDNESSNDMKTVNSER